MLDGWDCVEELPLHSITLQIAIKVKRFDGLIATKLGSPLVALS